MTTSLEAKAEASLGGRRRGGFLVAETLSKLGIEVVFTLSGGFINPILEGLVLHNIRIVNAPHEQVAGHLADGWARATRMPAVCLVGPEGLANAVPAMLEAYGQRSPVIFITGSSTLKRRGKGGFKEVDHVRIAEPLTKFSALVTHGSLIPDFIDKAFQIALDGQPGPVHISIPTDLLYSSYDQQEQLQERPFDVKPKSAHLTYPVDEDMEILADLLNSAERPILIVGNGVWLNRAEQELIKFSESFHIPALLVPYHQSPFAAAGKTYLGLADIHQYPPAAYAFENADLMLAVGCRLDNTLNFGNPPLIPATAKLVCINGSETELADNNAADFSILGSPKAVLSKLFDMINDRGFSRKTEWFGDNTRQRLAWVDSNRELLRSEAENPLPHPLQISTAVLNSLGENDFFVVDGGDTHYWAEIALNIAQSEGRKFRGVFHPGPFSLLGCGVPFGVALKMLHPESNVVVLSGDGAFMSGGLSIESSFREGAPITVVIDNNGGLGSIAQQQIAIWESGTPAGTAFRDIPFDGLFAGLGGRGLTLKDLGELPEAIGDAAQQKVPTCINVKSRSVVSPLVAAMTDRRAKSSIE
jgi:acetolactate synthase-1/2/3 large subunit